MTRGNGEYGVLSSITTFYQIYLEIPYPVWRTLKVMGETMGSIGTLRNKVRKDLLRVREIRLVTRKVHIIVNKHLYSTSKCIIVFIKGIVQKKYGYTGRIQQLSSSRYRLTQGTKVQKSR